LPAGPRAFALFDHCFTCGNDIFAASRVAEGLAALNIAVLRFDFIDIGSSEGELAIRTSADLAEIAETGIAEVTLAGRTFTITKRFLDDLGGGPSK
jgi:hypothetical protein